MNLEEDFNNEIKNKLDSRTFEYSEASWEKANALIQDAQKKKKRRFFFYLLSAGVILIGTIISLQYPFGSENTSIVKKEKNYKASEIENTNSNESDKTTLITKNNTANSETKIRNITTSTPQSTGEIKHEKINSEARLVNSNVNVTKVNKPKSGGAQNNVTKETNYTEHTNGEAEIKISTIHKSKDKTTEPKSTSDNIAKTEPLEIKENGNATVEIKSIPPDSLQEKKTNDVVKAILPEKDSLPKNTTNIVATETKKDSTKNKNDKLQIFAFAGAAFTPGYVKALSIKESINPSVGIFIRKTFKPNFGIGIGLFYTIYGNISESPKVFKNTSQDFGYKNETTEIKQSRLHYLKLPVMFDYEKGKNNFSIGVQLMYLITGSSKVTTYKESYGLKTDNASKKVYGYTNGFSSYDVSIILGYRRQITNKISVQFLLDIGFMDVKNNSYFNSNTFDRNKSLQLNLGYKLFSK